MCCNRVTAITLRWFFIIFLVVVPTAFGDLSYSIPEEMKRGTAIGNIAKDLGVDVETLRARKARIDTEGSRRRYCDVNLNSGDLIVSERIDREEICGEKITCQLKYSVVLEDPLELHHVTLQIQDINDNSPRFPKDIIRLEIRESADKGARFPVNEAHDADVGQNAVQSYTLQRNDHFVLAVRTNREGRKYGELVLEKELDREEQQEVTLLLIATDGGTPQRSGTVNIEVTVLDANDNIPVFSQAVYTASLPENSPLGAVVLTVSATDADEGPNGEVTYDFSHISDKAKRVFSIDQNNGDIVVTGPIDYEEEFSYEMRIEGKDRAGLTSQAKVIIEITDANDQGRH